MKKLLLIVVLASLFTACEGPEGPMGPMGPAGQDGRSTTNWYSTSITVNADEWILKGEPDGLNSYFCAYKKVSRLTDYIYRNGSVIAYIQTDEGVKNGMPFVLHQGEVIDDKELLWTQTYDFDFTTGEIGFYVTYSDFSTNIRPGTETFHIVLFWE
jgi:hypothetical protein